MNRETEPFAVIGSMKASSVKNGWIFVAEKEIDTSGWWWWCNTALLVNLAFMHTIVFDQVMDEACEEPKEEVTLCTKLGCEKNDFTDRRKKRENRRYESDLPAASCLKMKFHSNFCIFFHDLFILMGKVQLSTLS